MSVDYTQPFLGSFQIFSIERLKSLSMEKGVVSCFSDVRRSPYHRRNIDIMSEILWDATRKQASFYIPSSGRYPRCYKLYWKLWHRYVHVTIYRGPKFWQFILVLALKATISFPASLVQTNTDFHANFLFGPQPWIWLKSLGKLQSTKKISRALKG